ncbi:MAG: hypothetical protein ACRBCK_08655 [Alphaproteobacteria bacterium]
MKKADASAKDKFYKRGFGIGAALATASVVGALTVQSGYEDRVEDIQSDPDAYCTDLVKRKTAHSEANDNDKAQYVEDCREAVSQLPERSRTAEVLKPVAGAFSVASLGMLGLWGNHRRKSPVVASDDPLPVHEPD